MPRSTRPNNNEQHPADEQRTVLREKYIALWTGVVFFMTLIIVVWVTTVKEQITAVIPPSQTVEENAQWDAFLTQFQDGLADTKDSIAEVRETIGEATAEDTAGTTQAGAVRGEQVGVDREYVQKRVEVEKVLYGMSQRLVSE